MIKSTLYISILLLVCVLLLGTIIGFGISQISRVSTGADTKVVVVREERGTAGNSDTMPIYPRENPKYPLRHVQTEFQQVGTLTYHDDGSDNNKQPIILPLFGRPMPHRNERWEYYTATDKQNMLKIPLEFENKDCLEEIGCREVYNRDKVFIPAYQKEFEVHLYKYRDRI